MRLSGTFHLARATGTSGVAISRIQVLAMTRNANNSDSALGLAYNIESDTSESAYPGIVGKYCTLTYSGTSYFAIKLVATTGADLWGSNAQHCNFVGVGHNIDFFGLNSSSHTITSVSELTGREGTKTFLNSNIGINETNPINLLTISNANQQTDNVGNLQLRYTGSHSAYNSGLTVKNYKGTSQFMQWGDAGVRIGSRILTNSGAGNIYFTTGSDSVKATLLASNGNLELNAGNLVVGNGKGIDFSATSNASGMSIELLDSYEEGTWTPSLSFGGGQLE